MRFRCSTIRGCARAKDVVKAYAMGADYVFFGRCALFAIAARGEAGLRRLWDVLADETSIALAQLGLNRMPTAADGLVVTA